jgi:hypothetical protein
MAGRRGEEGGGRRRSKRFWKFNEEGGTNLLPQELLCKWRVWGREGKKNGSF